ncbi:AzlC family ABC transporter permease [Nitriliruptoraceae bacterium ZYF776]|nr:AzlC family ABC transporter permease [Profundirhabdus halotolerans]
MTTDPAPTPDGAPMTAAAPARDGSLAAALPVATAIAVFGVIYGAAARPVLGAPLAVVSSVLIFSGAAQFTMVALLAAGATPIGVLGGVAALALRHLPLGAVLRPRLTGGLVRRASASLFLLDETTGLALTRPEPAERTLVLSGGIAYAGWVLGTVAGVAGASFARVEPLADALFPVLFVGLTTLTVRGRGDLVRAVAAGVAALAVLAAWPAAGALGAIAVAVVVAAVPPSDAEVRP